MDQLHFLFLQGMQGAFFKRVGDALESRRYRVSRINLCLGDWIYWHGRNTFNFHGHFSEWQNYIDDFFSKNKITDLVLVGEQRRYHKIAIEIARTKGIRVIATDFGYVRPDWIALELNGLNGQSQIPKDIQTINHLNSTLPVIDVTTKFSDSQVNRIFHDIIYSMSTALDFIFFPHYTYNDIRPSLKRYPYSFLKWAKLLINYKKTKDFVARLASGRLNHFTFAMQLEHDYQMISYSDYDDLLEPLEEVVQSFALYSTPDTHLVIKNHPGDFGIRNLKKDVSLLAQKFNVEQRVHFIDGGTSLDLCVQNASGLVTVNSTSGLRALQLGCPVKTLASPVYDMPGLTHQGTLDSFWRNTGKPDSENVSAFINFILNKLHVRGVFFKEPGMSNGVNEFTEKLASQTVGLDDVT